MKTHNHLFVNIFFLSLFIPSFIFFFSSGFLIDDTTIKRPRYRSYFYNKRNGFSKTVGLYTDIIYFKDSIDTYFNLNFPTKKVLVNHYLNINHFILNKSAFPKKVIISNNGYFSLGDEYSNNILESKKIINFSSTELKLMRTKIYSNCSELSSNPNSVFYVIAPNKESVYSNILNISDNSKKSKLMQFDSICSNNSINVLNALKNADVRDKYYKNDSHWNDFGSFIAYSIIMNRLKVSGLKEGRDLFFEKRKILGGDLSNMINLYPTEYPLFAVFKINKVNELLPYSKEIRNNCLIERFLNPTRKKKIVIISDSFGTSIIKYFFQSFNETIWYSGSVSNEEIKKENADFVVKIIAERNIDYLLDKRAI